MLGTWEASTVKGNRHPTQICATDREVIFQVAHGQVSYTNITMVMSINKIWAQDLPPWKVLVLTDWGGKATPGQNFFIVSQILQYNSFQVPGYKSLEIFIWLGWKMVSSWSARFSFRLPPSLQKMPLSSSPARKFAAGVCCLSLLHGDSGCPGNWQACYVSVHLLTHTRVSAIINTHSFWLLGTRNLPKRSTYEFSDPLLALKANPTHFSNIHAIFHVVIWNLSASCTRATRFYVN